jgi:hypothetical protein
MNKEEMVIWAEGEGYKKDKFGHMIKEINGTKYRYKIQAISVRAEHQAFIVDKNEWILRWSAYLKDMSIDEKGALHHRNTT